MKFIRTLLAYIFLRFAQRNLDAAKEIYAAYEGHDFGQALGDLAKAKFKFWQDMAMAVFPDEKRKADVEYQARKEGWMP